jgi:hypothetical protein
VLVLTPNRPAAARADAPAATAAATRSRKSPEYGAGISPSNDMLRHQPFPDLQLLANPYLAESTPSETALEAGEIACRIDEGNIAGSSRAVGERGWSI